MTNSLPIHHESVDADTPRIKLQEKTAHRPEYQTRSSGGYDTDEIVHHWPVCSREIPKTQNKATQEF